MKRGDYVWDTPNQLRTRTELTLQCTDGNKFFTAGILPVATATLRPDGKTLDIVIWVDRVDELTRAHDQE